MTAQQHADNFVGRYQGVYIDEDGHYGSQCWDVVARYAREEYGCTPFPTVSGGAEGLWRFYANPIPQYFDKVPNTDLAPGDIAVWDASFYPPYGHTSLVWRREGNTIWSFEQDGSNDPNHDGNADGVSYLAKRTITSKLAGGLRPKGVDGMAKFTKEQEQVAAQMATGSIPGENYNYPYTVQEITSDTLNSFLQTWQSRVSLVTPEMEQTLAEIATGSPYGKDYNSQFQGKQVLQVLPAMLDFWLGQRSDGDYVAYSGSQLFTKK